ncbi:MAG: polysaccharide ABC transporter ATP-binding protein [Patescibacteria group bacterium]|nr:polysaccharide ABC transporter ATP-binding protein [Patescibacteria group bacterium]
MSPIIEVKNLAKRYLIRHEHGDYITLRDKVAHPIKALKTKVSKPEEFWALNDVSFNVEEGEMLGIIGHNGAGKSTLLKILSRITPPTKGEAKLRGRVSSLLEVGTGFHPELSGRENIFLSGIILGMTRLEVAKKFDEIVEFSGVEKFLDTPVKYYSSGMSVRLGFAVAANLDSEVLIIDEVLAVGDAEFQEKCLGKMSEVTARQGRTILFVSHNMSAIKSLCNKCICLKDGKDVFYGDVQKVVSDYLSMSNGEGLVNILNRDRGYQGLSAQVKVTNFEVTNDGVTNPLYINPLAKVEFKVTIKATADVDFSVVLSIKEALRPILYFNSKEISKIKLSLKKDEEMEVSLSIDQISLAASNYNIDCDLFTPGGARHDYVANIYNFSVVSLDPYSSGFNITNRCAVYHVNHQWNINKNNI